MCLMMNPMTSSLSKRETELIAHVARYRATTIAFSSRALGVEPDRVEALVRARSNIWRYETAATPSFPRFLVLTPEGWEKAGATKVLKPLQGRRLYEAYAVTRFCWSEDPPRKLMLKREFYGLDSRFVRERIPFANYIIESTELGERLTRVFVGAGRNESRVARSLRNMADTFSKKDCLRERLDAKLIAAAVVVSTVEESKALSHLLVKRSWPFRIRIRRFDDLAALTDSLDL